MLYLKLQIDIWIFDEKRRDFKAVFEDVNRSMFENLCDFDFFQLVFRFSVKMEKSSKNEHKYEIYLILLFEHEHEKNASKNTSKRKQNTHTQTW